MAQRELDFWDVVDAGNDFAATEGGMPENQNRTTVNNSARARMGSVRRWYDDPEWLALTGTAVVSRLTATKYQIAGADYTGYAGVGRRVRVQTAGGTPTNVLETFVVASTFTGGNTEIDITPDDSITAGIDEAHFYFGASLRSQAFSMASGGSGFFVPEAFTGVALQAAIDAALAAGGGIVLLDQGQYVLSSAVIGKSNVSIWGRGVSITNLFMEAAADLDEMILVSDKSRFRYRDFSIDGNRSNQAGGNGHGLHLTAPSGNCQDWLIDNVHTLNTRGAGFKVSVTAGSVARSAMSHCIAHAPGTDGFAIDNGADSTDALRLTACEATNPGQDGTTANIAAFRLAGRIVASNLLATNLNQGGAQNPRGLVLTALQAAEPNDESAEYCTVSGISVSGTATSARGIEVGGHNCSITGGQIVLSGSGSTGVVFDASVPSQSTYRNTLTAVTARCVSGTGFTLPPDANDNMLSGCIADDCLTGFDDAGANNQYASPRVYGMVNTTIGMTFGAASIGPLVSDPLITNVLGDGIRVQSGATRVTISGGAITGCTTGINNQVGSMGTKAYGIAYDLNPTDINDAAANILHGGGHGILYESYTQKTAGQGIAAAAEDITDLFGLAFPGLGPNGTRRYLVMLHANLSPMAAGSIVTHRLHMGPNGDKGDLVVIQGHVTHGFTPAAGHFSTTPIVVVTPAIGDKIGYSADGNGQTFDTVTVQSSIYIRMIQE